MFTLKAWQPLRHCVIWTQRKNLHNIGDNAISKGAKNSHSLLQISCFL